MISSTMYHMVEVYA